VDIIITCLSINLGSFVSFLSYQQAEKMVAYLQDSALDDERLASKLQEHRAKGVSSIPLIHEAMQKWYYKDPQGEIQGKLFLSTLNTEMPAIIARISSKRDLFNVKLHATREGSQQALQYE
jgi:hypothetical protein